MCKHPLRWRLGSHCLSLQRKDLAQTIPTAIFLRPVVSFFSSIYIFLVFLGILRPLRAKKKKGKNTTTVLHPHAVFGRVEATDQPKLFDLNTIVIFRFHLRLSGHYNLTVQASRLSSNILQRSFFFFARMSCSEQSIFHGQASDRVWSFLNCSFKASRRKKEQSQREH